MLPRKLSKCPMCRYSLAGLPARHQCPECGFPYDERMSIRAYDLKRNLIGLGGLFAWFLFCFGSLAYKHGIASVPTIAYTAFLVFPVLGPYFYRNRRRNKIISWPDGFQFIRKSVPSRVYAWSEIKSFRRSLINGWVYIALHDEPEERLFGKNFFGTHKKAARFVKEANELREEYVGSGH